MGLKSLKLLFFIGKILSTDVNRLYFSELNASNCDVVASQIEGLVLSLELRLKGLIKEDNSVLMARINFCNKALRRFNGRLIRFKWKGMDDDLVINFEVYKIFLLNFKNIHLRLNKMCFDVACGRDTMLKENIVEFQKRIKNLIFSAKELLNIEFSILFKDDIVNLTSQNLTTLQNPSLDQISTPNYSQTVFQLQNTQYCEFSQISTVSNAMYLQVESQLSYTQFYIGTTEQPYQQREGFLNATNPSNHNLVERPKHFLNNEGPVSIVFVPPTPTFPVLAGNSTVQYLASGLNRLNTTGNNQVVPHSYVLFLNNTTGFI